jgi:hypothetical protein
LKNIVKHLVAAISILIICNASYAQVNIDSLKVVIIRHAEKPKKGDNLNCMGLNRSQLLPKIIVSKFGVPSFCYVPTVVSDSGTTKHSRMFQTITPLAAQYNLSINSKYNGKDSTGVATDILKRNGTVLIVWDHKSIVPLVHAFGINEPALKWADDDFDSIWIITFANGKAILARDKENLHPNAACK